MEEKMEKEEMEQIFLSHSRRDEDIRDYFLGIFGLVGFRARAIEFEDIESPPWSTIQEEISNSKAVFLLLGKNVINQGIHTQNWISFEVGLACQMEKPIWVFEPIDVDIPFPVPKFDYYFIYDLNERDSLDKIRDIVQKYADATPEIPFGINSLILSCPHENCGIEIKIPVIRERAVLRKQFRCPACRQEFDII